VVDHAYAAANREIMQAIREANVEDPTAQHIVDQGPELGWQLAAADVAVVDVSAMVYDRLAAGKPLLITRPVNQGAQLDTGGYLGACEWLEAGPGETMLARIDEVAHDQAALERLGYWVERYFGDMTPGATTKRFHAAVDHLFAEWERFAAMHAGDGEVDDRDLTADGVDDDLEATA
jgi:hypothetical protein